MPRLVLLLAALFLATAAAPARPSEPPPPVKARCAACHGERGETTSEEFPTLAGQHAAYLERQLKEFTQRKRTNDNEIMHTIAERLTALEARAVAEYLASLK